MLEHILFRQLNRDSKDLDDKDDSRKFKGDVIGVAPCRRGKPVKTVRANNDTKDGCDGGLANIQLFFHEK